MERDVVTPIAIKAPLLSVKALPLGDVLYPVTFGQK